MEVRKKYTEAMKERIIKTNELCWGKKIVKTKKGEREGGGRWHDKCDAPMEDHSSDGLYACVSMGVSTVGVQRTASENLIVKHLFSLSFDDLFFCVEIFLYFFYLQHWPTLEIWNDSLPK